MRAIHLGNLSRRQVTSDLPDDVSLRSFSIESLLKMLSDVEEYAQIPVRHNEENLNNALAGDLGCLTGAKSHLLGALDSPHTKVFLLLLAHQRRMNLPIMDYVNDTKMILDQFSRIANAAIDIAADQGWIDIVMDLITVTQLVNQVSEMV
jgi:activating signal cointegrator complex subunit 3